MKNLLWILIGCVVAIALIVAIILLSTKKSESRKQYKECWSDEMGTTLTPVLTDRPF